MVPSPRAKGTHAGPSSLIGKAAAPSENTVEQERGSLLCGCSADAESVKTISQSYNAPRVENLTPTLLTGKPRT